MLVPNLRERLERVRDWRWRCRSGGDNQICCLRARYTSGSPIFHSRRSNCSRAVKITIQLRSGRGGCCRRNLSSDGSSRQTRLRYYGNTSANSSYLLTNTYSTSIRIWRNNLNISSDRFLTEVCGYNYICTLLLLFELENVYFNKKIFQ